MTGAIGSRTGTLGGAFAVMGGHAAERPLVDLAVFGAREWNAPVLELVDRSGCVAAQVLDCILIAEPVRPLHGVVHVPAPVVLAHVAERRRNAALRRDRVRAGREYLADAGGPQTRLAASHDGAQARTAGADHDDVVGMILDRIGPSVDRRGAVS